MNPIYPLMQREWLQHRFAWALLALVPLALALVLVSFGQIEFDDGEADRIGTALPAVMTLVAVAVCTVSAFVVFWVTSVIIATGLARRDHGDRSIEFWLSLPVGHVPSLAVPMLVHLVLVPAAALALGLLAGHGLAMVLVARFAGLSAWFGLPWADLFAATLALGLRLLAGLPLATLWLAPVILMAMLARAWIGRWGLPVLGLVLGLGGLLADRALGQPLLLPWLGHLIQQAVQAMAGAGEVSFTARGADEALAALRGLPGLALQDLGAALGALLSPAMAVGLVVSAVCFALLVDWRQRGSKAAD
ncbi:MAG TPA: hypothetical protein PK420_03660 [Rubrivivax sp.]|jgi:ABC-2 type transport system permease protein|nr:hypothetical protein [Betaproteobacteria bacterium]MBP6316702.1 hypothetical protein [Rubrivivax sp.]MBK7275445.1 hypothetical protein [Betaproteobacteria bacterium]MBK8107122.1 hypothetical protein [Betaproteobacteria bacterium]MBK8863413.1 hypothetical protein [Betaproteobacteria bacterium]